MPPLMKSRERERERESEAGLNSFRGSYDPGQQSIRAACLLAFGNWRSCLDSECQHAEGEKAGSCSSKQPKLAL